MTKYESVIVHHKGQDHRFYAVADAYEFINENKIQPSECTYTFLIDGCKKPVDLWVFLKALSDAYEVIDFENSIE
jgi:hypothetical protein